MSALGLVLCAIVLLGAIGVPPLFMSHSSAVGQRLGMLGVIFFAIFALGEAA